MTFKEYINGLNVLPKLNEFSIKLYNKRVSSECNFKVNLSELLTYLAEETKVTRDNAVAEIKLVDWFADRQARKDFLGVVSANILHPHPDGGDKPLVETYARFRVDDNTKFADGSTLRDNTYYHDDYGRRTLKMLPESDLENIIVPIDVTQEYMVYPCFFKALLKCNIIESEQTQNDTFNK